MVWRLVTEAQAQRALVAANSDMYDVKALGLLGLDGAVIAGLTAARGQLPSLWWIAVVGLATCVPFFLFTIAGRSFQLGPHLSTFYAGHVDVPARQAAFDLLAELENDLHSNHRARRPKSRAFLLGMCWFIVGAVFAAVFLVRMSLVA